MDRTLLTVKRTQAVAIWIVEFYLFICSLRLWLSGYVQDKDLVQHVKALNGARKAAIAANSKFLSTAVRSGCSLALDKY